MVILECWVCDLSKWGYFYSVLPTCHHFYVLLKTCSSCLRINETTTELASLFRVWKWWGSRKALCLNRPLHPSRGARAPFLPMSELLLKSPFSLTLQWKTDDVSVQTVYLKMTCSWCFLAGAHGTLFSLFKCRGLYSQVGKKQNT